MFLLGDVAGAVGGACGHVSTDACNVGALRSGMPLVPGSGQVDDGGERPPVAEATQGSIQPREVAGAHGRLASSSLIGEWAVGSTTAVFKPSAGKVEEGDDDVPIGIISGVPEDTLCGAIGVVLCGVPQGIGLGDAQPDGRDETRKAPSAL